MLTPTEIITRAQLKYLDVMLDVLVYTVVLNLFVEYVDAIVIDSFTVSLLTAVVMKVLIDLINSTLTRVRARFGGREGALSEVAFALAMWTVLFGSKIVILLVIEVIFENDVDLGSFLDVLALTAVMMIARRLSEALFVRLVGSGETVLRAVETAGPT